MKEKFWQRLAELIGLARLIDDRRFRTFQDRLANRAELVSLVQQVLLSRTTDEWIGVLRGEVPCAPVYTVEEALADEQVLAREMVVDVMHPRFGRLREVGCPVKFDDETALRTSLRVWCRHPTNCWVVC
jgi:crotonobetainyl-CoA:carnitine CoA-transferase CaiB-like acyl-CoA transferase